MWTQGGGVRTAGGGAKIYPVGAKSITVEYLVGKICMMVLGLRLDTPRVAWSLDRRRAQGEDGSCHHGIAVVSEQERTSRDRGWFPSISYLSEITSRSIESCVRITLRDSSAKWEERRCDRDWVVGSRSSMPTRPRQRRLSISGMEMMPRPIEFVLFHEIGSLLPDDSTTTTAAREAIKNMGKADIFSAHFSFIYHVACRISNVYL